MAELVVQAYEQIDPNIIAEAADTADFTAFDRDVLQTLAPYQTMFEAILIEQFNDSGITAATELADYLRREYRAIGKAAELPSQVVGQFTFDTVSPTATQFARTEAAAMVTNMVESQREALRSAVTRAYTEGRTPTTLSRDLVNILQEVKPTTPAAKSLAELYGTNVRGLTTRYETAVVNRAQAVARQAAKQGLEGTKALQKVQKETQKYADKLRKSRARTISRTELLRANNAGRLESFNQAVSKGLLNEQHARKQWLTSRLDVCNICQNANGQLQPLKQPFQTSVGSVMHPPAHPNCRCTFLMVTDVRLHEPPEMLGTGQPGDPFGVRFPGETQLGQELGARPLTTIETPPPPPTPPAPAVPQPASLRPVTSTPQGNPLNLGLDDLRTQADDLRNMRSMREATTAERGFIDLDETLEAARGMEAVQEAGDRIASKIDEVMEQVAVKEREQLRIARKAADDADEALTTVRRTYGDRTKAETQRILDEVFANQPEARSIVRSLPYDESGEIAEAAEEELLRALQILFRDGSQEDLRRAYRAFQNRPNIEVQDDFLALFRRQDLDVMWVRRWDLQNYARSFIDEAEPAFKTSLEALNKALFEANKGRFAAQKALDDVRVRVTRQVIQANRPTFGTGDLRKQFRTVNRTKGVSVDEIKEAIDETARNLPAEWVDWQSRTGQTVEFDLKWVSRGNFDYTKRRVNLSAGDWRSTLQHEVQHGVQKFREQVYVAERLFMGRRARRLGRQKDKPLQIPGHNKNEKFFDLDLPSYTTKEYPITQRATELTTTGMESLFHGGVGTMDGEWYRFMLGILALL